MEQPSDHSHLSYIASAVNKHDTRLAVLDERMDNLNDSLAEVKDNHLSHLGAEVDIIGKQLVSIEKKLAYYSGGAAVLVTITNFLFNYFLK